MSKLIQIVSAVASLKRIPEGFPQAITFFSIHDVWQFHGVFDEKICPECIDNNFQLYHGNDLRDKFPNLEITDIDRIEANVHPNCRCWLSRIYE